MANRVRLEGLTGSVLSRIAHAALAFGATLFIAKALGAAAFGAYALALAGFGVVSVIAMLGIDQLTVRELSVRVHRNEVALIGGFLAWARARLISSGLSAFVGALLFYIFNPLNWPIAALSAFLILMAALPAQLLTRLHRGAHQAHEKTALGIFIELPFWNGLLLGGALLLLIYPGWATPLGISWIHLGSVVIASIVMWASFARMSQVSVAPSFEYARGWMSSSTRFTAFAALTFLIQQADVLLVGSLADSTTTAIYSVASRLASLLLIFLGPIQQVFGPRLAKAWADQDVRHASGLAQKVARTSLVLAIPITGLFWFLPAYVLQLFGPDFPDAAWALRILAVAQFGLLVFGPGLMVLPMIHAEGLASLILIGAVLVGLLTGYLLFPSAGIVGIALGRMFSLFLVGISCLFVATRKGLRIGLI